VIEVATRVKEQLEELEGQVARAREDAKNILEEVEEIAEAVENEAENLQQEMGRKRNLSASSLLNQKSNYRITDKIQNSIQNLEQFIFKSLGCSRTLNNNRSLRFIT